MRISAQYLEGGTESAEVPPAEARSRLHDAFARVPLAMVLLGWDLDPRVVEACADECARHRCDLYLWQPVLTGHGQISVDARWRVIGPSGDPVPVLNGKPEFTFMCPNQPEAREVILRNTSEALAGGHYQGVFLDRIRFPSPAADFGRDFACFCDACRAAASEAGLDLMVAQEELVRLLREQQGRQAAVSSMLLPSAPSGTGAARPTLSQLLEFRQRSISGLVREIAEMLHARGLRVGLDCFSPTLARMVGQDLSALARSADWIKVMTYARAFAPASLSYEVIGLTNSLLAVDGESEERALDFLSRVTGWPLPRRCETIRSYGLPAAVLSVELQRGRISKPSQLLAGIELVEGPETERLGPEQMREDAEAVRAAAPDGVVFSWDLWRIRMERLELAGSLYGDAASL